jgi:hypothetical protein
MNYETYRERQKRLRDILENAMSRGDYFLEHDCIELLRELDELELEDYPEDKQ